MTEAPERIVTSQCGKTLVHDGMKRFETDVEYIRADHVDALLKAEREKALREAVSLSWLCFHKCDVEIDVVTVEDILALIENPAD